MSVRYNLKISLCHLVCNSENTLRTMCRYVVGTAPCQVVKVYGYNTHTHTHTHIKTDEMVIS